MRSTVPLQGCHCSWLSSLSPEIDLKIIQVFWQAPHANPPLKVWLRGYEAHHCPSRIHDHKVLFLGRNVALRCLPLYSHCKMTTRSTGTVIVWDIEQSMVVHSKARPISEDVPRYRARVCPRWWVCSRVGAAPMNFGTFPAEISDNMTPWYQKSTRWSVPRWSIRSCACIRSETSPRF